MDEFAPLLIILLIWIFVGLPSAMAKKVREQKTASKLSAGARSDPGSGKGSGQAPVPERQTEENKWR